MKIFVLSPYPEYVLPALHGFGAEVLDTTESPEVLAPMIGPDDWAISFGYRYLIGPVMLQKFRGKAVNIHISMLPYNRGADPNFWSFFDNTPKGITIHRIERGLDTGPIYDQCEMRFEPGHTLKTSYETLQRAASLHFAAIWDHIYDGTITPREQPEAGTYHRSADKNHWMGLLPLGWDAPVRQVEELGEQHRGRSV